MNRKELRELASLILNFNPLQTDQNFTTADINTALDQVYNEEVNGMSENGLSTHFTREADLSWPSGSVTFAMPPHIRGKLTLSVRDVTNDSIGEGLMITGSGAQSTIFWKDRSTLQWGTTGPSDDTTLRVKYMGTATPLLLDTDAPELVPPQFHYLLAWAAAIWLKVLLEEAAPGAWIQRLMDGRARLYKLLSRGDPVSSVPSIQVYAPYGSAGDSDAVDTE